jgi:hypothetical protein
MMRLRHSRDTGDTFDASYLSPRPARGHGRRGARAARDRAGSARTRDTADHPERRNVAATRELCAPSIFRSSFSNWQPAYGMGEALAARGVKKACWVTWDYAADKESGEVFRDGLRSGGGELVQVLSLPFPEFLGAV